MSATGRTLVFNAPQPADELRRHRRELAGKSDTTMKRTSPAGLRRAGASGITAA